MLTTTRAPAHTLSVHRSDPPRFGAAPTRRACEAAARLGLSLDLPDQPAPESSPSPLTLALPAGSITLIIGPSGSGKSTLLRDIRCAMCADPAGAWRGVVVGDGRLPDRACVDLFESGLDEAMRALARAGLADAACFVKRPRELSEGQRARLRLALAMHDADAAPHAPPSATGRCTPAHAPCLLIDEFAANLDQLTGAGVARLLRRFVDRSHAGVRVIVATPREELASLLDPEQTIRLDMAGRACNQPNPPGHGWAGTAPLALHIDPATLREYARLAPLHYRSGRPATIVSVLAAWHAQSAGHARPSSQAAGFTPAAPYALLNPRRSRGSTLAGVLVVSMPALNASWRGLAWPGRFNTRDRAAGARRLNAEVRCISRVIVDPRFRALGVARRLVRAYLDAPLTPCTEALAAMGRAAPFFAAAGMTAYAMPPSARDARLLDALEFLGVEPWRLATPEAAFRRAAESAPLAPDRAPAFLEGELRLWARASRATARSSSDAPFDLFRRACRSLAAAPIAYAHTQADQGPEQPAAQALAAPVWVTPVLVARRGVSEQQVASHSRDACATNLGLFC